MEQQSTRTPLPPISSDDIAVKELKRLFASQRAAFLRHSYPSYAERIETLRAIEAMVLGSQKESRRL